MAKYRDGNILTTGQVARLCGVAPRTVTTWMEKGILAGHRIPGGADRRFHRDDVLRFARANGIKTGSCRTAFRMVVAGVEPATFGRIVAELSSAGDFECRGAATMFDAGRAVESFAPDVLALDWSLGRGECCRVARRLAETEAAVRVVGLAYEDESDVSGLESGGFARVLVQPLDAVKIADAVAALLRREPK